LREIRLVSRLDHTLDPNDEAVRRIEVITGGGEHGAKVALLARTKEAFVELTALTEQVPVRRRHDRF
jgi:hypothetical protein